MPAFSDPAPRAAFATVAGASPEDRASWDRIFLTFDIDWAPDDVLSATIDLVEEANVAATWFATHDTPLLDRLRENPLFELGIHPNFLPLLNGDKANGANAEEVVDRLLAIVPEAKSVRSHSLVQGGRLLELFRAKGLTHECNSFVPEQSGIELKPWVDWFGMIRLPYFWEDDFSCETRSAARADELSRRPGVRGFDFHPIHVYLNTERLGRYEEARSAFPHPERLKLHRNSDSPGICDFLKDLLALR